jgi:hypothetical protein
MKDDFSDLRFSDYYSTLPYWIEASTTRVTATVWVKLTEINEAAREFFSYYGNGGAVSESNGTNTFDVFDDFTDTTLNARWTTLGGTNSQTNNELLLITTSGAVESYIKLNDTTTTTSAYRLRAKNRITTGGTDLTNHLMASGPPTYSSVGCGYPSGGVTGLQFYNSGWKTKYNCTVTADVWYILEFWFDATHLYALTSADNNTVRTETTSPTVSNWVLYSYAQTSGAGGGRWDWVLVRKHLATEPTCTPAAYSVNTAFYQMMLRAKHTIQESYPYTLAVSFVTDHMHLTWTEP